LWLASEHLLFRLFDLFVDARNELLIKLLLGELWEVILKDFRAEGNAQWYFILD
jgi:hypothetical protein